MKTQYYVQHPGVVQTNTAKMSVFIFIHASEHMALPHACVYECVYYLQVPIDEVKEENSSHTDEKL